MNWLLIKPDMSYESALQNQLKNSDFYPLNTWLLCPSGDWFQNQDIEGYPSWEEGDPPSEVKTLALLLR